MTPLTVLVLPSFALLASALAVSSDSGTDLQRSRLAINTTSGTFAPYFPVSHPGIVSFPDVPYARNPTGPLRFALPAPATPPTDGRITYAAHLPAGCFQYVPPFLRDTVVSAGHMPLAFQRGDYSNTTEDCLRLSIFAPKRAITTEAWENDHHPQGHERDLLPVVIWLHGGGFMTGGTNVPYQLAPSWVQRSQRHIVVQVQYRLNLLGLPNASGLASVNQNVNLALLDQRLAVEWVRDNIASLGGDPSRITLWGESAGADAVDNYAFAWADDPIVAGIIADSGNAIALGAYTTVPGNYSQFSLVAKRLGCGGLSPTAELSCMRAVPAPELQAYIQAPAGVGSVNSGAVDTPGAADDGLAFPVLVDNFTVFSDYERRIKAGGKRSLARIPLLIGTNTDEGNAVVPFEFDGSATADSLPATLRPIAQAFKLGLQCTTLRESRLRAAVGLPTWQYLYAGNFTDVSPRPWLGAYHTAELPMVFGTFGLDGPATGFESRVSRYMQDLYLAFAEDPVRGLSRSGWPMVTGDVDSPYVMKWAGDGKVSQLVPTQGLRGECVANGYEV